MPWYQTSVEAFYGLEELDAGDTFYSPVAISAPFLTQVAGPIRNDLPADIYLAADPIDPMQAATKNYVDLTAMTRLMTTGDANYHLTDGFTNPNAIALGGTGDGQLRNLIVRGQPYMGLDSGTLLSLVNSTAPIDQTRAGIASFVYPSDIAAYYGQDAVLAYIQTLDGEPILTVTGDAPPATFNGAAWAPQPNSWFQSAVTFSSDGGKVLFSPPLPANIVARLKQFMIFHTNVVDPTVPLTYDASGLPFATSTGPTTLPAINTYSGVVAAWDPAGAWVSTYGMAVFGSAPLGSSHSAFGQVPNTAHLDTSQRSSPTVWFGAPHKLFAMNWYQGMTNSPNSRARYFQGLEVDLGIPTGAASYTKSANGIVIGFDSYTGTDGKVVRFTDDTTGLFVNGGGGAAPTLLRTTGAGVVQYRGDGYWLDGGAVASPLPAVGSTQMHSQCRQEIDTNYLSLSLEGVRLNGTAGWQGGALRYVLTVDGTEGKTDGAPRGYLQFDGAGSVEIGALQSGTPVPGIVVNGDGTVTFPVQPKITAEGLAFLTSGGGIGGYISGSDAGNLTVGTLVGGGGSLTVTSRLTAAFLSLTQLPTSATGLTSGMVWVDTANGNVLKHVT
jgi:hypothetical protein